MTANAEGEAGGILDGVRILSLAEQYPGPYATLLLADMGADVVLVERPAGGDPSRVFPAFFEALNRNKRSVALDLKDDLDRERFLGLARAADVVLEGYRPGTAARLGIDYPRLAEVNPGLVYLSITGFGQDGPYRSRSGHDVSYAALAGVLFEDARNGTGAAAPPIAIADLSAGLFAAIGVLGGLFARQRDGRGMYVDVSMLDGLVSLMTALLVPVVNGTGDPGFPHEPGYRLYRTADGEVLALGVAHEDHFWRALCAATGLDDVAGLSASERLEQRDGLVARLEAALATRNRDDWVATLVEADVPVGPAHDLHEVAGDPHVRARGLVTLVPAADGRPDRVHIRQPLGFAGHATRVTRHAPRLGEHTQDVLGEVGWGAAASPPGRRAPAPPLGERHG